MPAPAADYDALQAEIGRRFPGLSRQLQRIARFALERPQDVALDTVAAAASKAEVQPSAMVRFAQALGYGGYTDMQRIFRDRLVERSASYRERIATIRRAAPGHSRPRAVLHDFVSDSIARLSRLEEHMPPERLARAVEVISGAERIHVLGEGGVRARGRQRCLESPQREYPPTSARLLARALHKRGVDSGESFRGAEHETNVAQVERAPAPPRRKRHLPDHLASVDIRQSRIDDRLQRRVARRDVVGVTRQFA